jgi:hypothetical protein
VQDLAATPKNLRLKGLIVCEAMSRLLRLMSDNFDCDIDCFACYLAVISANLGRMRRDAAGLSDEDPPPDEARLPVSRRAIAASVGLPRETVRRKVIELIQKGHLVEVRGGLKAAAPILEHANNLQIVLTAMRTFERTVAELKASDER